MTSKTRYGLIFGGLLIFSIGAPSLVLFVQGKKISLEHGHTELTGILAVETDPSGASIVINDIPEKETPGAVRFLKTGDYSVKLTKKGYRTWQKTLSVVAGKVTHINPTPNQLVLLKDIPPVTITEEAATYTVLDKKIIYARTSPALVIHSSDSPDAVTKSVPTPEPMNRLLGDFDNTHVLAQGATTALVADTSTLKVTDVTKLVGENQIVAIAKGRVWTLDQSGQLQTFLPGQKTTTKVLTGVLAALVQKNELYYLKNDAGTIILHHAQIDGEQLLQDQTLTSAIGPAKHYAIFTDTAKAVYLLADEALFRMNEAPTPITQNVKEVNTDGGSLAYTTPGELWWFDSNANKPRLVSRASAPFTAFYVNPSLQYAFFVQEKSLIALELDDRAGQNRYVLDAITPEHAQLFFAQNSALLYRVGGAIKSISLF